MGENYDYSFKTKRYLIGVDDPDGSNSLTEGDTIHFIKYSTSGMIQEFGSINVNSIVEPIAFRSSNHGELVSMVKEFLKALESSNI